METNKCDTCFKKGSRDDCGLVSLTTMTDKMPVNVIKNN